jgi:RNA polymerase sigma-70 factor (ECF subfamily)
LNREIDLLQRARNGDREAGEELYVKYLQESKAIQGLLRHSLSNPDDREEMLNEIYLQLIGSQNLFRGDARLSTYIYQVARITVFQKFRKENTLKRGKIYRKIQEPFDIADGEKSSPEYYYKLKQGREILAELISRLPEAYREALRLRVLEDLSYDEIAERLKIPLNTVSTKIHKGKKLLSVLFRERGLSEVLEI